MRTPTLLSLALVLSGLLATGSALAAPATPAEPELQTYSLDFELKYQSDRRTRGVSDTYNDAGMEFTVTAAHESGLLGLLQIGSVSKTLFPNGNGMTVLGAVGYRNGTASGWRYGVGLAQEWFPGSSIDAPTGVDWQATALTGEPAFTGMSTTRFDTSYLLLELGYGLLDARYLYVLSKDFRGNNTATLCGSTYLPMALMGGDPSQAMQCYGDGMRNTGGSHLLDLDMRVPLNGQTKMIAHLGYQKVANFSDLDGWDYRLGLVHTRWGTDFSVEWVGATLRNRDFANITDADGSQRRVDAPRWVLGIAKRF